MSMRKNIKKKVVQYEDFDGWAWWDNYYQAYMEFTRDKPNRKTENSYCGKWKRVKFVVVK